jgi:selenocysteine lyase/cysteine desulfurase
VPARAAAAAAESIATQTDTGRAGKEHFERIMELRSALRQHAAWLMGCPPGEVALTHSTTDGMNLVLRGHGAVGSRVQVRDPLEDRELLAKAHGGRL